MPTHAAHYFYLIVVMQSYNFVNNNENTSICDKMEYVYIRMYLSNPLHA